MAASAFVVAGLFLGGCDGPIETDAGPTDAGSTDAGPIDAGPIDAGPIDAGPIDAGPIDAGPTDAGPTDAGPTDAGPTDAGLNDAGQDGGEASVFEQAVDAIGGEAALANLQRLQIDAAGVRGVNFEAETPDEQIDVSTYDVSYLFDLDNDNLRVDATRTPLFEAFQFFPASSYRLVLNGDVGALDVQVGFTFPGNLASQSVGALRTQQRLFNPYVYLREGLADPTLISNGGAAMFEGRPHRIFVFAGQVSELRLFVDDVTGFISKLETTENNPLVRDTPIEVRYRDWQSQGSLAFPNQVELDAGGLLVRTETRSAITLEPTFAADTFDLPAAADNPMLDATAFSFGQQSHQLVEGFFHLGFGFDETPAFAMSEVVPGITLFASAANTLAINTTQGLVVLEAPNSPKHGTALIDALAISFPGVAISHVVQSHHHQDHASGMRSFVAAGATAVVGNGVADFWNDVFSAASTIRPDALSAANVTPVIEEVPLDGTFVIQDANVTITVHHVSENPHAEDMVITVIDIDNQRFVYEADLYNAGFGFTVVVGGPQSFFASLRDLGIIDASCASQVPLTIVPAHGVALSLADALAELAGLGVDVSCP